MAEIKHRVRFQLKFTNLRDYTRRLLVHRGDVANINSLHQTKGKNHILYSPNKILS